MNKLEFFSKVTGIVTELTDVSQVDITNGSRTIEAVDARWLIIKLMREKGYSSRQIAPLVNCAKRSVTHALQFFKSRTRDPFSSLGNNYEIARQKLRNIGAITQD